MNHNPTTRILQDRSLIFSFCSFSSVTLRGPPLYLGNQERYHRSAGVKTTRKNLNKKIKEKKKYSSFSKNAPFSKNVLISKKCKQGNGHSCNSSGWACPTVWRQCEETYRSCGNGQSGVVGQIGCRVLSGAASKSPPITITWDPLPTILPIRTMDS